MQAEFAAGAGTIIDRWDDVALEAELRAALDRLRPVIADLVGWGILAVIVTTGVGGFIKSVRHNRRSRRR